MIVTPFYNKPPFRGILAHYEKLAQESVKPLMVYHVPSRTSLTLSVNELAQLCQISKVEAIKEAHDPVGRYEMLKSELNRLGCSHVRILSGDDISFNEWFRVTQATGGIVSVASNVAPHIFNSPEVFRANLQFVKSLYVETNPIPVKMALFIKGIIDSPECRLPLTQASSETENLLKQFL